MRRYLSAGLLGVITVVAAGASAAHALVLCVNASGVVYAQTVCKPGTTALDVTFLQGPPGPAGPQGPVGPAGPEGPSGSTTLHLTTADAGSFVSTQQLIQLPLPVGTYLVAGKVYITSANTGGCNLVSGPSTLETFYDHTLYPSDTVSLAAVMFDEITLVEPTTVGIRCGTGLGGETFWAAAVLFAVPVAE